jgi:hypothetical protein
VKILLCERCAAHDKKIWDKELWREKAEEIEKYVFCPRCAAVVVRRLMAMERKRLADAVMASEGGK